MQKFHNLIRGCINSIEILNIFHFESGSKPTPTPEPPPTPGDEVTDVYQAEDADWLNGRVETRYSGYTGTGYVKTENAQGTWIEFTVNMPVAATVRFTVFYLNRSSATRPADLSVNDLFTGSLPGLCSFFQGRNFFSKLDLFFTPHFL